MILWLVAAAALLVALAAWRQARRTAARLEQLSQMYWELRYRQGELQGRTGPAGAPAPPSGPHEPAPRAGPNPDSTQAFIPLVSLKR